STSIPPAHGRYVMDGVPLGLTNGGHQLARLDRVEACLVEMGGQRRSAIDATRRSRTVHQQSATVVVELGNADSRTLLGDLFFCYGHTDGFEVAGADEGPIAGQVNQKRKASRPTLGAQVLGAAGTVAAACEPHVARVSCATGERRIRRRRVASWRPTGAQSLL